MYDNEDILLELDGSNNITARYTHGPGIDEPLILEKGGASFFYHADGLGSITEITNNSGSVVQAYTYSSFGKIESQLDPTFIQPYTFTGREFDPETGLYFYRARTYDPVTGRFLQIDQHPGFASLPQTLNKYPYVINRPVTLTDPNGKVIGVIVGTVIVGVTGYLIYSGFRNFFDEADRGIETNRQAFEALERGNLQKFCLLIQKRNIEGARAGITAAEQLVPNVPGTTATGPIATNLAELITSAISSFILGSEISQALGPEPAAVPR